MKYYPIYLDMRGRRALIIGGGPVALQKIRSLLEAGADVHVVAPDALPAIAQLSRDGKMTWSRRPYKTADLKGARLVIAATSQTRLQKKIAADARSSSIWVNVVDVPRLCDFIAPALLSRGPVQIAISTGGAAPALAKHLRRKLEAAIGEEYAEFAQVVMKLRPKILKLSKEKRQSFWECVVSEPFFDEIRRHGIARAEKRLKEWIHDR